MYASGYSLRMFQMLENELINYFNYIPLEYYSSDERKKIYSPKLNELLIRIGSQVDIFFRNWDLVQSKNRGVLLRKLRYGNYQRIDIKIDDKEIKIIATDETFKPFNNWKSCAPDWWKAYNEVKHNGYYKKEDGNLFNVIESLSALFLLNCIHEETQFKLVEYGYIKIGDIDTYDLIVRKKIMDVRTYPNYYITSQIFEFETKPILFND